MVVVRLIKDSDLCVIAVEVYKNQDIADKHGYADFYTSDYDCDVIER